MTRIYPKNFETEILRLREIVYTHLSFYMKQVNLAKEEAEKRDLEWSLNEIEGIDNLIPSQTDVINNIKNDGFNEEYMNKLLDARLFDPVIESADNTMRKYLGFSNKPRAKIGNIVVNKNGLLNAYKEQFEANDPQKRIIENASLGIKVRIMNKKTGVIISQESILDQPKPFMELELGEYVVKKENWPKTLPWDRIKIEERDNVLGTSGHYELLSIASLIKFYAEGDLNNEAMRLESRIKSYGSFASKLVDSVFFKPKNKIKFPKDFAGVLRVMSQPMIYDASKSLNKNPVVINVSPQFSEAFAEKDFKNFDFMKDKKFLNSIYHKADELEKKYVELYNNIARTKGGKNKGWETRYEKNKEKLDENKNDLIIFSKPIVKTNELIHIRHADFLPEWKKLYDNSVRVGHDIVYVQERRDANFVKNRYNRMDEIIPFLINTLKIPLTPEYLR